MDESIYSRSLSIHRAAVAQITGFARIEGQEWVHVRLVTAWYDWDAPHTEPQTVLTSGESLVVDPKHLEAIRR